MGDFVRRRVFNDYILGLGPNWPVASFPHPGHGERRTIAAALNLGSRFAALQGISISRPRHQNAQTEAAWELVFCRRNLQTEGCSCETRQTHKGEGGEIQPTTATACEKPHVHRRGLGNKPRQTNKSAGSSGEEREQTMEFLAI